MLVRIDDRRVGSLIGVGQIELCPEQPFIEEPGPARVAPCRGGADHRFDGRGAGGAEEGLQDAEIDAFILEGEGQMALKIRFGGVPRRVNAPAIPFILLMVRAYGGQDAGHRNPQPQGLDQGGIARWRGRFREPALVKSRYWP